MRDEIVIGDSITFSTDDCSVTVQRGDSAAYEVACGDCQASATASSMDSARAWGERHGREHQWHWSDPDTTLSAADARSRDPAYQEALDVSRRAEERYAALRRGGRGVDRAELDEAKREMEAANNEVREIGREWWLRIHRPEEDDSPLPSEGFTAVSLGVDPVNRPRVAKRDAALHDKGIMVQCGARTAAGGRCQHPVRGTQCAAGHSAR